ncbi:MAG: flagellar basal body-associated FliL family protein [Bdellovibrionales bacterium]|nr:flagellar basal body-associated FliL family protein [Bdellovibrionales bacterium]
MRPKTLSQNLFRSDILRPVSDSESKQTEQKVPEHETPPNTDGEEDSHPSPDASVSEEINPEHLPKPKLKELILSPDPPSRYLTWLSLAFGGLAILFYGLLVNRYFEHRNRNRNLEAEKAEAERLYGGWLNKQNAFNKMKMEGEEPVFTQSLGEFRVLWATSELRADLVAECTSEEICNALKERPEQVHDLILPVFQVRTPEQVLNPNSKLELRREIVEKLNSLKLKGKILQVDFTDLTIEPAKGVDLNHE